MQQRILHAHHTDMSRIIWKLSRFAPSKRRVWRFSGPLSHPLGRQNRKGYHLKVSFFVRVGDENAGFGFCWLVWKKNPCVEGRELQNLLELSKAMWCSLALNRTLILTSGNIRLLHHVHCNCFLNYNCYNKSIGDAPKPCQELSDHTWSPMYCIYIYLNISLVLLPYSEVILHVGPVL